MVWNCQGCQWGPAWTMRAVANHGKATGHQIGGTSGPDWIRLWWWLRLVKATNLAAVAAILSGITSLVTQNIAWGLWALTCAVLAGVLRGRAIR